MHIRHIRNGRVCQTWFEDKLNRIIAQDGGKTIEQGWQDFLTEFFNTKEGRQVIKEVNDEMKARGLVGQQ